jgi:hypothetical protein
MKSKEREEANINLCILEDTANVVAIRDILH